MPLPSPSAPRDLFRTDLVERIRAAGPSLIALSAPAGFGKTTLARQLLAEVPAAGTCAAPADGDDLTLAAVILTGLAEEDPARAPALGRMAAGLGDTLVPPADRLAVVLAAWRTPPPTPSWFVLDDLDRVPTELLGRLLAERPEERTLVLCSRTPVKLHLSRFAAPHRIITLRADELAFTPDEIAAAVDGTADDDPSLVERIGAVSAGWPVAVLLLARFAREGRAATLLERLDDLAYEQLHEYLADQVLIDAPPAAIDGLLICSALPDARDLDVAAALEQRDAITAFTAYARTSPFVTRTPAGTIAIHPLAASTVLSAHAGRLPMLLGRVAAALREREPQRAAEAYLAAGDRAAAAEALAAVEDVEDGAPPLGYARVLHALGSAVLQRTPRLWAVTALLRAFVADAPGLLHEADGVCARAARASAPSGRLTLSVLRALLATWLGETAAALTLVDDLRASAGPSVLALSAWLLVLRSALAARLGRLEEAETNLEDAWHAAQTSDLVAGTALIASGADVARVRGERERERERLARASERLLASGLGNVAALAEAEATFGAWLAGEDLLAAERARLLDVAVEREGTRAFSFFAAAARGRDAEPTAGDDVRWIARGWLIAAAHAGDQASALQRVERARAAAQLDAAPFPQVLAAVALAALDPTRRSAALEEARAAAARIDAPALHAAITALDGGEGGGMLAAFVARYRRAPDAPRTPTLAVDVATGRVLREGKPLALPEREHALMTALAVRRDPIPRTRLTDALWPDLDEGAARNAFHVCLHRLKTRLGDERAVVRSDDGYRLGDEVAVDLWEIERAVAALRPGDPLDDARATGLHALYERLRSARPPRVEGWEWFEPTE
ncbi:MAG: hypothetical protein ABR975_11150, partial [Vulcanimicrobiaceae bacterium]